MEQGVHVGQTARTRPTASVKLTTARADAQDNMEPRSDCGCCEDAGHLDNPFCPVAFQLSDHPSLQEVFIRLFDIVGSFVIMVLSLPVILVVALAIKVFSPGPIFYTQRRVGKAGSVFTLYKFRTMVPNAEDHVGPVWATPDDSRVTPVGKMLRRTRLDELPQIFNVLMGDMSLVGPRPERPYFVERHKALQGMRLSVKPGITGLAQVRSCYDLKPDHKIKYDYLYIQRRSLLLNLYILLQTIPVLFTKKGW